MATEAEIHDWIAGYPRDWDQLCQALMWQLCNRFGSIASTPSSAIEAYQMERAAGRIEQGTPPAGTFVYWDIGTYGHVGFVLNDGRVFMATSHLAEQWTDVDAGWNTLEAYNAATGATYLGYSWRNGGNVCPFTADSSSPAGGGGQPIPIEGEEMSLRQAHYVDGGDVIRLLFSEESGYCTKWSSGSSSTIANAMSTQWGTGPSVEISKPLADQMQADLEATRARKA